MYLLVLNLVIYCPQDTQRSLFQTPQARSPSHHLLARCWAARLGLFLSLILSYPQAKVAIYENVGARTGPHFHEHLSVYRDISMEYTIKAIDNPYDWWSQVDSHDALSVLNRSADDCLM